MNKLRKFTTYSHLQWAMGKLHEFRGLKLGAQFP